MTKAGLLKNIMLGSSQLTGIPEADRLIQRYTRNLRIMALSAFVFVLGGLWIGLAQYQNAAINYKPANNKGNVMAIAASADGAKLAVWLNDTVYLSRDTGRSFEFLGAIKLSARSFDYSFIAFSPDDLTIAAVNRFDPTDSTRINIYHEGSGWMPSIFLPPMIPENLIFTPDSKVLHIFGASHLGNQDAAPYAISFPVDLGSGKPETPETFKPKLPSEFHPEFLLEVNYYGPERALVFTGTNGKAFPWELWVEDKESRYIKRSLNLDVSVDSIVKKYKGTFQSFWPVRLSHERNEFVTYAFLNFYSISGSNRGPYSYSSGTSEQCLVRINENGKAEELTKPIGPPNSNYSPRFVFARNDSVMSYQPQSRVIDMDFGHQSLHDTIPVADSIIGVEYINPGLIFAQVGNKQHLITVRKVGKAWQVLPVFYAEKSMPSWWQKWWEIPAVLAGIAIALVIAFFVLNRRLLPQIMSLLDRKANILELFNDQPLPYEDKK